MSKNIIKNIPKKQVDKKKIIIVVAISVLLIIGGVGAFLLLGSGRIGVGNTDNVREDGSEMTNGTKRAVDELKQLQVASVDDPEGSYGEIMGKYNDLSGSDLDDQDKQKVLQNQAAYLLSIEKYDEALAKAQEAEAIISNFVNDSLIALIAEAKGDKQMAIDYNKKLLDQYSKELPVRQAEYDRIEAKINRLEAEL